MPIVTASILGGVQSAAGIAQFLRGRSLAKQNIRAEYQIPPEIAQNLSQAQMQALQGLPPEQVKQYVENVQRQVGFGLTALGDRKAGIAGLATLTQQGTDAYKDLLTADARARQENLRQLMSAREQMAGYKEKEFQINKLLPYQEKAEAAAAMQGAGLQNIMGGLQGAQRAFEQKGIINAYQDEEQKRLAAWKEFMAGKQPTTGVGGQSTTGVGGQFPGITGLAGLGFSNAMNQPAPNLAARQLTEQEQPISTQRADTWNQYQIAKMTNPNLTYQQFLMQSGQYGFGQGFAGMNVINPNR